MANIRVSASKKATVIILLLLFLVVGGTGVYLLWRVNQQKTLAPVDSDASDNMFCNCCPTPGSSNTEPDCYEQKCIREKLVCEDTTECESWDNGICIRGKCSNNGRPCDSDNYCKICTKYKQKCEMECVEYGQGNLKPGMIPCICTAPNSKCAGVLACGTQCSQGSQCSPCAWPLVAFCQNGNCACLRYDADGSFPADHKCDDTKPCTLGCPSGYSDYREASSCAAGEKEVSGTCYCSPCNNPYTTKGCCKPAPANTCGDGIKGGSEACDPPGSVCTASNGQASTCTSTCTCPPPVVVNTCDAKNAKWVTKPATTIPYGQLIPFEYITGDTDGVQNVNIIVKLDGTSVPVTKIPATDNAPNITVKGTLNGSEGVLSPGNHKLEISWNDIKGAGGVPCYAYSMITVLPENPEWDIEKKALQTCVNDWTENPTSNLTYTVTITNTNTGSGAGTITSILDTLDPKVDSTKVTNISNGGVIQNGIITWNLTSPLSDFDPGESKSFTYSISVNKESFGIYENTVVATPDISSGDSSNLEASVNIEARCNVPGEPVQPDTGLFDDSKNIVILGAALLFAGLGWSWITDSFGTMKQKISYESKARFEKRVSKR